ncbi:MAG: hypothetical protein ACRELA_10940 [Candidatus Rokuibacteriota bacterium]
MVRPVIESPQTLSALPQLQIEPRPDGSLLLSDTGRARWGLAAAGVGACVLLLGAVVTGDVTLLGGVVVVPLGLIALLTGLAAARHRDWVLFDRRGREIVFRRGLASIFRPVRVVPFDEVEAIVVDGAEAPGGEVDVHLLRGDDLAWPIDTSADSAYVNRLVTSLSEVGGWPVIRNREAAPS